MQKIVNFCMPITNAQLHAEDHDIWLPPALPEIINSDRAYNDHILRDDFRRTGSPAISIGFNSAPAQFSQNSYTHDMFKVESYLVKDAGNNEYKIPKRISPFCETFLKAAAGDQHARCPLAEMKYAVLYFRRSYHRFGEAQTAPDWHSDDIKKASAANDLTSRILRPADNMTIHGYMTSNLGGTRVQSQHVRYAEETFTNANMNSPEQLQNSRVTLPHEIALFNSYNRHVTTRLERDEVMALVEREPLLAQLVDGQGVVRAWAGLMYIPTEAMEPHLGKYQRIQEATSLDFDK